MNSKIYNIEVTEYHSDDSHDIGVNMIQLETDRLEWSMEQYGRNRQVKSWRVISELDGSKTDNSSSV
jgi:hypothetical protein